MALYDDLSQEQTVIRHLENAGCTPAVIRQFTACAGEDECLKFLAAHRKRLLQSIHESQRKLDTLDFFIFEMKHKRRSAGFR